MSTATYTGEELNEAFRMATLYLEFPPAQRPLAAVALESFIAGAKAEKARAEAAAEENAT